LFTKSDEISDATPSTKGNDPAINFYETKPKEEHDSEKESKSPESFEIITDSLNPSSSKEEDNRDSIVTFKKGCLKLDLDDFGTQE